MKASTVLFLVGGVFLAVGPAVSGRSGDLDVDSLAGHGTFAVWTHTEGDVFTHVTITASTLDAPGATADGARPLTLVTINRFDVRTGAKLMTALGSAKARSFSIDPALGAASLRATLPMYDSTQADGFTATIDVTWAAAGPVVRETCHAAETQEQFSLAARFSGEHRPARATGIVLGMGASFASGAASRAEIQRNDGGALAARRL